jgi:uncharacterized RDD family membrane protein YckC
LLDLMIVIGLIMVMNWVGALVFVRLNIGLYLGYAAVFSVAAPFLYFILFEGLWNGQTLGKRAAGIRVRMADGTPITFAAALGRNLLRPADMLPGTYFVGLLAMFTNPRAQRIGDLAAGTVVCYETRPVLGTAPAPHTAGIHPLEEHVGQLRGMTLEEYNALRRLADRYPELTPDTQQRLMETVWAPIAERRKVQALPDVDSIYLVEAVVMRYGREHGLL